MVASVVARRYARASTRGSGSEPRSTGLLVVLNRLPVQWAEPFSRSGILHRGMPCRNTGALYLAVIPICRGRRWTTGDSDTRAMDGTQKNCHSLPTLGVPTTTESHATGAVARFPTACVSQGCWNSLRVDPPRTANPQVREAGLGRTRNWSPTGPCRASDQLRSLRDVILALRPIYDVRVPGMRVRIGINS